ncbi:MAG: hypothetical protein P8O70_16325 [SAR324 cluster bacterium]|nr:hypothetical protein [SAR324 cluster bacterium]
MQSISEAAAHLQVGKSRLYALLKDHRIEPCKNGRRKELSDEQVEQLVRIIAAGEPAPIWESMPPDEPLPSDRKTQPAEEPAAMILVEELRNQNQVLLEQLHHEQDERKAERQERENYQQMLAAMQQNNHKLLQENNRLQLELLEAPKQSKFDVDSAAEDVEDSVDISTTTPAASAAQPMEYTPRSTSSWGLGIGLGAVAAAIIFYVLVGDQGAKFFPNIQQKLVGALDMTDTTSIVPYQFDAGGGLR